MPIGPRQNASVMTVSVARPGAPQIKLRANTLNEGRENRDVVALALAVVERHGMGGRAPLNR